MKKSTFLQKCISHRIYNPLAYSINLYNRGLSTIEISEHFSFKYGISITSRAIADKLRARISLRDYSERRLNAIKRGRMVY